jgi:hypothetical protein
VDPSRDTRFEAPLWRALAVFRLAALPYALILIGHNAPSYRHRAAARDRTSLCSTCNCPTCPASM